MGSGTSFTFDVRARDLGSPPRTSTPGRVTVTVRRNNNGPYFINAPYIQPLERNATVGELCPLNLRLHGSYCSSSSNKITYFGLKSMNTIHFQSNGLDLNAATTTHLCTIIYSRFSVSQARLCLLYKPEMTTPQLPTTQSHTLSLGTRVWPAYSLSTLITDRSHLFHHWTRPAKLSLG